MTTVLDALKPKPRRHPYTYEDALAASEKIAWRLEDVIGDGERLDFTKPFMPEALARVEPLAFLSDDERLKLNQIRGNGYLRMFGLVEEFVLPFVLDHARGRLDEGDARVRALLQFAGEEAKHIELFKRFAAEFERGFGVACAAIGPAAEIARAVLAYDPLAVGLAVLQLEWMTQRHYLDSVKDDRGLDPLFKNLLKYHWLEETQHAKLDTLMVEALADARDPRWVDAAVGEYLEVVEFLHAGLMRQVELDLVSFEAAAGRSLSWPERDRFLDVQRGAMRWTFLGSGMTHESFLATLDGLGGTARERVEEAAAAFR